MRTCILLGPENTSRQGPSSCGSRSARAFPSQWCPFGWQVCMHAANVQQQQRLLSSQKFLPLCMHAGGQHVLGELPAHQRGEVASWLPAPGRGEPPAQGWVPPYAASQLGAAERALPQLLPPFSDLRVIGNPLHTVRHTRALTTVSPVTVAAKDSSLLCSSADSVLLMPVSAATQAAMCRAVLWNLL